MAANASVSPVGTRAGRISSSPASGRCAPSVNTTGASTSCPVRASVRSLVRGSGAGSTGSTGSTAGTCSSRRWSPAGIAATGSATSVPAAALSAPALSAPALSAPALSATALAATALAATALAATALAATALGGGPAGCGSRPGCADRPALATPRPSATRTVAGLTWTAAAIAVRVCPSAASARMRAAIAAVSLVGPFGPHLAGISPATPPASQAAFHRHSVASPIPNPAATAAAEAISVATSCTAASRRPTSSSVANAKVACPNTNTVPPSGLSTRPAAGPIGVASATPAGAPAPLCHPPSTGQRPSDYRRAPANHRSPTRQIACSEGKFGSASHVYVRSSGAWAASSSNTAAGSPAGRRASAATERRSRCLDVGQDAGLDLGGAGEAVDHVEGDGPLGPAVGEVEDAAAADRGRLVRVADEREPGFLLVDDGE